ncbi:hypothetical protein HanPI659440_Chr00c05g0714671 [Helianthus annuus]|nr:hypothetical protein HanPI659440_Chr00c05g0714671 [Helianthus annuus]
MSPYEKKFVDVKFVVQLEGFVTVTLDEVSQNWRYGLLVGGIALLYITVSNSKDTPLAVVAVCSCLALCDVITSIM